jgi:hypothetical protein
MVDWSTMLYLWSIVNVDPTAMWYFSTRPFKRDSFYHFNISMGVEGVGVGGA